MERIVSINDLSGMGRCSLYVAISIMSAMSVQCCPLPTSILSNQTGYPKFSFFDFTGEMEKFLGVWAELKYKFNNIHSGFLGNKNQVDIVIDFIKNSKTKDANIVVDTVMGDNGKLYKIFDNQYVSEMRELAKQATVITPNVTELFLLANKTLIHSENKIIEAAKSIAGKNTKQIIVTGILEGDKIYNYVIDFENAADIFKTSVPFNKVSYSGTGDIFSSIVSAGIAKGKTAQVGTELATEFIYKAVTYTNRHNTNPNDGVLFENFIRELTEI